MRLPKEAILGHIKGYQDSIAEYQQLIAENKKELNRPDIPKKTKQGFQMLNDICKEEIRDCQRRIDGLLHG